MRSAWVTYIYLALFWAWNKLKAFLEVDRMSAGTNKRVNKIQRFQAERLQCALSDARNGC